MMRRALLPLLAIACASCGRPAVADDGEAGAQPAPPVQTLFITTLDNLRTRPLFSPTRTAPQTEPDPLPEPEPVAPDMPEPDVPPADISTYPEWLLIGIVRSDTINRAIFRTSAGDETFSLASGESRDGWTLATVSRASVTLENAGGLAELPLGDPTASATGAAQP
ncbi:MAG: hypothetical protein MUC58_01720 [Rhizobiaceae bacterium]|jgi:hypothetical protein|nr:hypothetical protein [Rhizobiaceae bacterium]